MNKLNYQIPKNLLLKAVIGSCLFATLPTLALAQTNPNSLRNQPSQPPLPEQQQAPKLSVRPVNGQIQMKLMNRTAAPITYQVIGEMKPRTLAGKSEVTLLNLETPVTLTFQRQDRGLLNVQPQTTEPGNLEVTFTETTELGIDKNAIVVEETGTVFLN